MRPLTVVQICADRGIAPGSTKGAAQHLRGVASGLMRSGHRVTSYTARKPEGLFPVPVRRLRDLSVDSVADADAIYERYSLGHRAGLDLARAAGIPFVLEVNAPLVDEARAHRPDTVADHDVEIETELLRGADLVITVSTALTRWVAQRRSGPTVTITNGFEPTWFPRGAATGPEPTLVFLGHPKPWHGADRLPQLLADLAAVGHRPRLDIVGGGTGADRILAHARELGVDRQITVTGPLPPAEASARLTTGTIGLAPYRRHDPFYFCPLKVVDYLAAGLPVVSTRQGDIPALVDDAGLIVEPDDDRALTEAVATLLDAPDLGLRLGRAGRDRAMATMTWDHAAARTAAAIEALDHAPVVV